MLVSPGACGEPPIPLFHQGSKRACLEFVQSMYSVGYIVSINKCCSCSRPSEVSSVVSELLEKLRGLARAGKANSGKQWDS